MIEGQPGTSCAAGNRVDYQLINDLKALDYALWRRLSNVAKPAFARLLSTFLLIV
jgi:hypothetical protein